MEPDQPLPRLWMMTDERQGEALLPALARLPEAAGIVFRHYSLPPAQRRALFDAVRTAAGSRLLLLAGPAQEALAWGADGSHGRGGVGHEEARGLRTAPVHDAAELRAAEAAGASLVFVSPVFATRSHPGAATLGVRGFLALAQSTALPAVALGGMDATRGAALMAEGAYGWAAIDAWGER